MSVDELLGEARRSRDAHTRLITYSPKVFIPLTKLCRDVCHYCTFAAPPKRGERAYLTVEEVLEIARSKKNAAKVEFVRGSAYEIPDFGRRHDALFAGFWWSHVPLARMDGFLQTVRQAIAPGALIAFLDNRHVPGSSTAVSRRDAGGNTYQTRKLDDGSTHEVLKNFPAEGELIQRASRHGWGAHVDLFEHYWLLTYWAPK